MTRTVCLFLLAVLGLSMILEVRSAPSVKPEEIYPAARKGDLTTLEKAVAEGVPVDRVNKATGLTPWQLARISGREDAAEILAKGGADVERAFPAPEDLLDKRISQFAKDDAPGIAVLVAKDGKIVFERGYGLANLEEKEAWSPETVSRIGSISKQFTATAILLLVEEGKLKLDDPISKFYPDFPRGDDISIHHLLTHTSGLKTYTGLRSFMQTVTMERSPEEVIAAFRDLPLDFEPGMDWAYCNSGYFLLGEIAGQVAEMNYVDYLQQKVFEPLGMEHIGAHRPGLGLEHEALGYERKGEGSKEWEPAVNWHMSQAGGAGELYSNLGDLYRWNRAIFSGEILSAELLTKAHTAVKLDDPEAKPRLQYGYGWAMGKHRGLRMINHSGGLHGFSSFLTHYPEQDFTVVVLANSSKPLPGLATVEIGETAAQIYLWQDMSSRPGYRSDGADLTEAQLQDYIGTFDFVGLGVMRFRMVEGKLQGRLATQPWNFLVSTEADVFAFPEVGAKFTFHRDAEGKDVTAVTLDQRGINLRGPKFEEPEEGELDRDGKLELAGNYDFVALDRFSIRVDKKGQILAKLGPQQEFAYFPVKGEKDKLFCKAIRVELVFTRDDEGEIEGMVLHQNGAAIPSIKEKEKSGAAKAKE